MAQHIGLQSETLKGETIARFDDGESIDLRIFSLADPLGPCVRFIDPYGDTIFNGLQITELIAELSELMEKSPDELFTNNVKRMIEFLRSAMGVDVFVRFMGD